MKGAVFPRPMPGRRVVGYQPQAGSPRDVEGRLLLSWIYAPEPAA